LNGFAASSLVESFVFTNDFSEGDGIGDLSDVVFLFGDEESADLVEFDVSE